MHLLSDANAWFERAPVPVRIAVMAPLLVVGVVLGIAFLPLVWLATLFGPRSERWGVKQVAASFAAWAFIWFVGMSIVHGSSDWTSPSSGSPTSQVADYGYTPEDRAFLREHGVEPAEARATEMAICRGGGDC